MKEKMKNTQDLRATLLETIADVKGGALGAREGSAIAALAGNVIKSAELDLKATRFAAQYNGAVKQQTVLVADKGQRRLTANH